MSAVESPVESPVEPTPSSTDPDSTVGRRHLLRGGAVLAGAAGVAALSAVAAPPAQAADGDAVLQGRTNDATSTTDIRIGAATGNPDRATLALRNANGPSLELQALAEDWEGELAVGQIANTRIGPLIGVVDPEGSESVTYLATEYDLLALPQLLALSPERLVDTRNPALRGNIIATPAANFDSAGRLLAGRTMSVAIAPADGAVTIRSAFLNVVSTGSLLGGFFTVYPPGVRPAASTINFAKGQTIANGALVAVDVLEESFAFTIFSSVASHVIVDVSGIVLEQVPGPLSPARRRGPGVRRPRAARRLPKLLGRAR